jgi:guanine deaminase
VFSLTGTILHTPVRGELEAIENGLVVVDARGDIEALVRPGDPDYAARLSAERRRGSHRRLSSSEFLLPGLVDLHVHAPQWSQLGLALDLPLEEWLERYTFPLESRFSDTRFARGVYESLVDALLAHGTTTAAYFASIHLAATVVLADVCREKGQRAVIGKVAMDDPESCPADYRDASARRSLDETREFIAHLREGPGGEMGLVLPAVTPRFIPSCTDALLSGLGEIARETGCHVQTHCSESDWEHRTVLDRTGRSDTRSLEDFGLLTRRTVLAHAVLVDDDDLSRIAAAGSGIAHCPLSNVYLSNAVFPARRALDRGVHVGLGTDIAGGPSPSLLANCRMAVAASRTLEQGVDPSRDPARRGVPGARIDFLEAFWMATVGGGLALERKIGKFEAGHAFDAIVVDADAPHGNLGPWQGVASPEDALQKIVHAAGRQDITAVWVQGRQLR